MAKIINPITTARAIVSTHARWMKLAHAESLGDMLQRALAREGRRDMAQAQQVLRSTLGRLPPARATKGSDYLADCQEAVKGSERAIILKALEVLCPTPKAMGDAV